MGLPGGSDGKESACDAGDVGLTPGSGRDPREENDCPCQYSCLENPIERGAWWATVHAELYKKGVNDQDNHGGMYAHSPRARHPGVSSQMGLRKHYNKQSQWK